jgi:hypothetical protein
MSIFNFEFGGKRFEIQGPPGATEAQARAIFDQQARTGALVGLNPGDVINAVSQSRDGLTSALGSFTQQLSGVPGGPAGAIGTSFNALGAEFQSYSRSAVTIADQAVATLSKATALAPTNTITVADFAKQSTALVPMQDISLQSVRATLSQISNSVGQSATELTNDKGLGLFGLNAQQLETAGFLKPGTVGTYLASGANDLTSVLTSSAVWTGKDGINNLDSMLSSPQIQSLTQQTLMSDGLSSLKQVGVPVSGLSEQLQAGLATISSKSPIDTTSWIQNKLPENLQAQFDSAVRDTEYAVGFAEEKLNDAMKDFVPPGEAENTVDRATLTAAVTRVFGNDKIPSLEYGATTPPPANLVAELKAIKSINQTILDKLDELGAQNTTTSTVDAKIAKYTALRSELKTLLSRAQSLQKDVQGKPYSDFANDVDKIVALIETTLNEIETILLPALRNFKTNKR